ncbi:MAG: hypothetical protein A2722_02130 [Candidatus Doudnabacteria bacterium RIFCSPHIGHO2_01_FULL_50_11]|uniref:Uncharacterized protein n=1 Tax=Candidatus Doudnabacteria bacterium RIFCSPHIGHO2_01_FULL_50_11 TaxID=1817828 RepID=A0A1F5PID2_9BACT|nr:MAG: hypothetical protein A2722_02130 [Candidatus Doudnabacteria bacterium RIFCSPHIGHO2_01_FULL_50_11]HLC45039.1 hypothetical protein [Patescibacteria group bacterium]
MSRYLSSEFLFRVAPALTRADQALFIAFVTLLLLAVSFRIFQSVEKRKVVLARFFSRCFNGLLIFALIGGLWSGIRYLVVPILGSHFVALLILAGLALWLFFVLKYALFRLASEQKAWEQDQVKKKYLASR